MSYKRGYRVIKKVVDLLIPRFFDFEVINKPDLLEGSAVLFAVNHIHALDPIFISYAVYPIWLHHVAKEEIFRIPLVPFILNWLGVIPVNRNRPGKNTVKKSLEVFNQDKAVCIFPQGTRRTNLFGRIKKGAARLALSGQVPIYPVAITGLENIRFKEFFRYPKIRILFGEAINIKGRAYSKDEIEDLTKELEESLKILYEKIRFQ